MSGGRGKRRAARGSFAWLIDIIMYEYVLCALRTCVMCVWGVGLSIVSPGP